MFTFETREERNPVQFDDCRFKEARHLPAALATLIGTIWPCLIATRLRNEPPKKSPHEHPCGRSKGPQPNSTLSQQEGLLNGQFKPPPQLVNNISITKNSSRVTVVESLIPTL
jgi:hypothetical protein